MQKYLQKNIIMSQCLLFKLNWFLMFLKYHPNNYQLSLSEGILSVATLSGLPYAIRHWDLANTSTSTAWGHRFIAIAEGLPIAGGLIAIIERIIFAVKERFFNKKASSQPMQLEESDKNNSKPLNIPERSEWSARKLTEDAAYAKMRKNALKALNEHRASASKQTVYATIEEVEASVLSAPEKKPLSFKTYVAEAKGERRTMEDAHFIQKLDQGLLVGVLDGHGGRIVANYAANHFPIKFNQALKEAQGNVHQAFEKVFDELHKEMWKKVGDYVAKHYSEKFSRALKVAKDNVHLAYEMVFDELFIELRNCEFLGGSTAVISFVSKANHCVYTATLADSEANIYRKLNDKLFSIPLSVVRDWSSEKDALRAAAALNNPEWKTEHSGSHKKRFPSHKVGLNVSRTFGDFRYITWNGKPAVSHKPKITVSTIQPGDMLVLACDGLKDFVLETDIAKVLSQIGETNPAEALVNLAFKNGTSDNVTVVAVKFS